MSLGPQHVHARRRIFKNLEPFPSRVPWKRTLDYAMYAVGVIAPLALLPQAIQIYSSHSAVGVSLTTWAAFTCFNSLWALYGAVHKDKQLLFASAAVAIFDFSIVVGILLY